MPGWTLAIDVDEFRAVAGSLLAERPAENTVALTALERFRARPLLYGEPLFGWWMELGKVRAAVMHLPPFGLLLAELSDDLLPSLVSALRAHQREIPGVFGRGEQPFRFAAEWRPRDDAAVVMRQRLYAAGRLTPPDPMPPGALRIAAERDRQLLIYWSERFDEEAGVVTSAGHEEDVADRLSYYGYALWEVDGEPVALGGVTRPAAGVVRIGPVYTPPVVRRRGYGAAVTWAVTRRAQDQGMTGVVLFADLANPVSNSIYQAIGYRPVADWNLLAFPGA